MTVSSAKHWSYKADYDADIERLYREYGWGAMRIHNELKNTLFIYDLGIATVNRRLKRLKEGSK